MGIYFMLWGIIQHYLIQFLLKLFQLWPLGVLSVGSHGSLTYTHQFFVCFWAPSYFLALQGAEGSSCIFVAPVLESAILPRRIDSGLVLFCFVLLCFDLFCFVLFSKNSIKNQNLGSKYACCYWVLFLFNPLS